MTARPAYQRDRKPPWFKARFPGGPRYQHITSLLREHNLHTVCEEAHCPNIGECFNAGTATFMILGDTCTRSCAFCAINSGRRADAKELLAAAGLGHADSALEESYSEALEGAPEYPHYTRPPSYRGWQVPEILLSGDHERIRKWRRERSRERAEQG